MKTDLSFSNPNILSYFKGDDSYKPVRELLYLHTHPLSRPNFLTELETLIDKMGEVLIAKKVPSNTKVVIDLYDLTSQLGVQLGTLEIPNPEEVLQLLRKIYVLCNSTIKF